MTVKLLPDATKELLALPVRERAAMVAALEKLQAKGDRLSYPHSSAVRAADATLRELRPRSGRSAWRALYRRQGNRMVVAAIAPEAQRDERGFDRAIEAALTRLVLAAANDETDAPNDREADDGAT